MNPLRFTTALLLLSALACRAAPERPNIVWLTSEDHGPEMGCYGDPLARTPHVDALAAQGMRYRLVWSTAPVCAPSRTAIISGLYPSSSGGIHMRSRVSLPPGMHLYPHYLRAAGYYTTNNDKEDYNLRAPANLWDASSKTAHWRNRAPGQPFFAIFNSMKSHESQIRKRPHTAVTDPAQVRLPAYHPDTPEVRQDWAQYYDQVSAADADAGARLREIEAAGLAADTIIFYYGDHGRGMPRSKRWPSNSGLHVPLVVYFPERWRHLAPADYTPGGESARFVSFVDLAPTLLSLGGTPPPAWMQGQAFAGPHAVPGRTLLFGERGRMDERLDLVRSVTDGRYVYLRNYLPQVSQGQHVAYQFQTPTTRIWREHYDQGKTNAAQSLFWQVPKAPEELYDLTTDPDEVHNLAALPEHRPVLERLRQALRSHLLEVRDLGFLPERELHARSGTDTPYALARDPARYPLELILETAELASILDPAATPTLVQRAAHADSAVRYWATLGLRLRGAETVRAQAGELTRALADESPDVRIVAAEAFGHFGTAEQRSTALAVLRGLASPGENGVFVALSALQAIEALGDHAAELHPFVAGLDPNGPLPDPRFNGYVASLIESITGKSPAKQP
ncbi:Sulfatase [Lacunisphaera limnophila]|uniref:Sulfatase n=1 Tax=Lacunisphaera limnophila TaxID=1838286 RepID=A0A1D8AR02_9BACT|nr:sulfatase-like hydrolase/transferase [Lacunisphaera limnophila]AOS43194.1 Sulfatase [Lacunisphaera limnophila]